MLSVGEGVVLPMVCCSGLFVMERIAPRKSDIGSYKLPAFRNLDL